jgi:hypothetical protein
MHLDIGYGHGDRIGHVRKSPDRLPCDGHQAVPVDSVKIGFPIILDVRNPPDMCRKYTIRVEDFRACS